MEPVAFYPSGGPDLPRPARARMKGHRAQGSIQIIRQTLRLAGPLPPSRAPFPGPLLCPHGPAHMPQVEPGLLAWFARAASAGAQLRVCPQAPCSGGLWERTAPAVTWGAAGRPQPRPVSLGGQKGEPCPLGTPGF